MLNFSSVVLVSCVERLEKSQRAMSLHLPDFVLMVATVADWHEVWHEHMCIFSMIDT